MPLSILVVDDDQDVSLMLQDRLTSLGFSVTTASDGAEGIAMLKTLAVHGILLDIQMPIMDGLTMLDQVRKRYPNIPVIVMSAGINKQKLIQAMERGAHDYLLKPVDMELLFEKCCTVFSSSWTDSDVSPRPKVDPP